MAEEDNKPKINIDGSEYALADMSDKAKELLANVQFVDDQIQQLNNEWAVSDTTYWICARFKRGIKKVEDGS